MSPRSIADGVAFVGPMPPAKTGIASYDAKVVEGLERIGFSQEHRLKVFWPVKQRDFPTIAAYPLGVFQLGNNIDFHGDIYRLANAMPSLVVLHDLALDDFIRGLLGRRDPLGAPAMRQATQLGAAAGHSVEHLDLPLRVPWWAAISRKARGLIVHSDFGRRYLEMFGCRTPIYVVPHPVMNEPSEVTKAADRGRKLRASLGSNEERFLIVVPGDMNTAKGIDEVIEAVALMPPHVHLALVGRRIPGYEPEAKVSAAGIAERVTIATDVSDDDFLGWLSAADVVSDLRFPHRGEVSGTLIRAMQAGRPCIVSGTGTYLDLPEGSVVRVTPGRPQVGELIEALTRLDQDRDLGARIGSAAAAYVEQQRATDATAHGYAAAIRATLSIATDPAEVARLDWARALIDLGVGEDQLARGHGLDYARALDGFKQSS